MALISRSIPTLLRGISQSSDATKKPDHAEIQDNADSDPVLGLVKRSGSQFVSNLILVFIYQYILVFLNFLQIDFFFNLYLLNNYHYYLMKIIFQ